VQVEFGLSSKSERSKGEVVASVERPGLEDFNPLGIVGDRAPGSEVEKR
jgi:hypothetical protein